MPRSKRARVVHTSKTKKQTKVDKSSKIDSLRSDIESAKYVYLISFDSLKTAPLQDVRKNTPKSKFFFGKNSLARVAIGTTPETELRDGIHKLCRKLQGKKALIISSLPKTSMKRQLMNAEEEFEVKLTMEGLWSEKTGFIDLSTQPVKKRETKTRKKVTQEEEIEEQSVQLMEDDDENLHLE